MAKRLLALVALVPLLVAACRTGETGASTSPDAEADREAIVQLVEAYDRAINEADTEVLGRLYAEDAVQMPADAPAVSGRAAIQRSAAGFLEEYQNDLTSAVERIRVSGDLATMRGTFYEPLTPRQGGEPLILEGNWLLVLERQTDGAWRIVEEMWTVFPEESGDAG